MYTMKSFCPSPLRRANRSSMRFMRRDNPVAFAAAQVASSNAERSRRLRRAAHNKSAQELLRWNGARLVTGSHQRGEMCILGEQVVGIGCDGAVREDIVIEVRLDDMKLKRRRNAQEVSASEFGQVHE